MSKKKLIILLVVVFISCSLVSFFFKNQKSQREDIKVKEQVKEEQHQQEVLKSDIIVPSLILTQDKLIMYQGDQINYASFVEEASDNLEGDLKDKVTYKEIDTSKLGEQFVEYEVSDTAGNIAKAILQVIIRENPSFKNDWKIRKEKEHDWWRVIK